MDRIVKLYTNNNNDKDEIDDRPQAQRNEPRRNNSRPSFYHTILNGLGFYGVNNNDNENIRLPDNKEVKRNRMTLFFLVIGIFFIFYVFH